MQPFGWLVGYCLTPHQLYRSDSFLQLRYTAFHMHQNILLELHLLISITQSIKNETNLRFLTVMFRCLRQMDVVLYASIFFVVPITK